MTKLIAVGALVGAILGALIALSVVLGVASAHATEKRFCGSYSAMHHFMTQLGESPLLSYRTLPRKTLVIFWFNPDTREITLTLPVKDTGTWCILGSGDQVELL